MFFLRSGSLWIRFWTVQPQFWRVQNLIFRCFVARAGLQFEKILDMQKPIIFPRFLFGFYKSPALSSSYKTTQNRSRSLSNRASYEDVLKTRLGLDSGRVWRSLGRHLADFCMVLGGSRTLLGASWASLGHFLGAFGCLWAVLRSFRAAFWLPGVSQALWECPGLGFDGFSGPLFTCFLLRIAFRHIMFLYMQ